MNAPFNKGDKVTVFRSWDDKGTIRANRFTVASCGTKRMHLVCDDGTNAEFRTYVAYMNQYPRTVVMATASNHDEEVFGLTMADALIAAQREHFADRIARWGDQPGFRKAMENGLAALHAPEFRTDITFKG